MLPLSPEPMRSSTGNSIESVEQPWLRSRTSFALAKSLVVVSCRTHNTAAKS